MDERPYDEMGGKVTDFPYLILASKDLFLLFSAFILNFLHLMHLVHAREPIFFPFLWLYFM